MGNDATARNNLVGKQRRANSAPAGIPVQRYNRMQPQGRVIRRRKPLTKTQKSVRWIARNAQDLAKSAVSAAMIALCAYFAISFIRRADENVIRNLGREKGYIEYSVKSGDTIWDISCDMAGINPEYKSARAYMNDLRAENDLHGDRLAVGQVLRLPCFGYDDASISVMERYGLK